MVQVWECGRQDERFELKATVVKQYTSFYQWQNVRGGGRGVSEIVFVGAAFLEMTFFQSIHEPARLSVSRTRINPIS